MTVLIVVKDGYGPGPYKEVLEIVHDIPGVVIHGTQDFRIGDLQFLLKNNWSIWKQIRGLSLSGAIIFNTMIDHRDEDYIRASMKWPPHKIVYSFSPEDLKDRVYNLSRPH